METPVFVTVRAVGVSWIVTCAPSGEWRMALPTMLWIAFSSNEGLPETTASPERWVWTVIRRSWARGSRASVTWNTSSPRDTGSRRVRPSISILEMDRISPTRRSMFSTSRRVSGRIFPVSLYLPMPKYFAVFIPR